MITTIILLGLPILLPTAIAGIFSPDLAGTVFDAMADLFAPFYLALEAIIELLA